MHTVTVAQKPKQEPPNIIAVIRMFRSEFNMDYQAAKLRAVKEFDDAGWPVPESIRQLCKTQA